MRLTHVDVQGTRWPFAAWYGCCFVFVRNAPTLDYALYQHACKGGIVFG